MLKHHLSGISNTLPNTPHCYIYSNSEENNLCRLHNCLSAHRQVPC